jgi:iron complex outermembrane receptor protein
MKLPKIAMRASSLAGVLAAGALVPLHTPAHATPVPATESVLEAEVVVTARKIEENLQDVPMSVKVLSGEHLDDSGTTRLHELQFAIPGLVVNNSGMFGAGFSLRGVADQRVAGLSVAPHLNGVYLGNANVAIARLFDIERIEVLKGPQGTLYGRNATGGSINVITRAPQDFLGSEIEVAHGSFETTRAQGHLNLPIENAGLRLAFIASEGDGYIRNSVDDRRFAEDDYWGVRGSLRIDAGDALRIDIMAQHLRDDGATGDLWSPRPDFLVDPRDIRLTTVTIEDPYLISEIDNLSFNLEYDLGFATLRSITGYAQSEVRNVDDCAGSPLLLGCVRSAQPNEFDQWSQELQLVFPRAGAIEGIVGAYYADADSTTAFYQLLPEVNPRPLSDNLSTLSDPASALFGQATLYFANRWSVTAGLRLSREEHRATTIGTGTQDSQTLVTVQSDSDNLSWLLDLGYAISEDAMLYAAISTGYKSGGFITTTLINGEPDTYGPEYLTAFEIGGKSRWLAGRLTLNAAAFLYDYEDLQVNTAIFLDNSAIFSVDNAAKAELYGIDAEMTFAVSERWSVSGGVVWLPKREFVEYRNEVTGDTLSGNDLVRAPEWSANGAVDYEHPLGDLGSLSARLEYSYRSGYFYTPENAPFYAQDSFGLLNAYLKFEAASQAWYAYVSGRNLTNEDYFTQVFLQSSPGYPDTYEIGVGIRF